MTSPVPIDSGSSDTTAGKAEQIAQIVADCLRRRAAGENLDDRELLAGRDRLMPELADELLRLRLIADRSAGLKETVFLKRKASGLDSDDESQGRERHGAQGDASGPKQSGVGSRGLRIRCPFCHEPLDIVADAALIDIPCHACGNRFNLVGDDRITGSTLGHIAHFELLERLGMGGFGTVWKARDTKLGRTVAVKIPRKGKLDASEVDEFLREARIAAQLKHPHIVSVHEIGRDGETVYIVSDFVEGWSLSDWRRKQRLSIDEAAALVATVSSALHYAHEAGVVHRDLKPQNVMIDDSGRPHVMDFGLAKREAEDLTVTADGDILGTPAYMSPEQAKGNARQADRRSDVYSLGVMLFELITDELPFRGNALNLIRQTIQDDPPRPSKLNSTVPRDLETICLKCLEKEPARRYATSQDVADELNRFRSGEPVLARRLGRFGRAWRWARRHPLIPALYGTLAIVVLIAYFVGWLYFEQACRRLDAELTSRALSGDKFAAASVAETAGRDFARRYEAVERAARDPVLTALLIELDADADFRDLTKQLGDPLTPAAERQRLKSLLEADPRRIQMQNWTLAQRSRSSVTSFAWFVTGPDGLQLSRDPIVGGETIGVNYAWRSYFHGGPHDQEQNWRPAAGEHVAQTSLSAVFVSQFTDQWVVVVSAPIEHEGKFIGVLSTMIELGKFAELPGNEAIAEETEREQRFAVLVDTRAGNRGQVLQHPLYMHADPQRRRSLLDRSHERQYAAALTDSPFRSDYRDPFAGEHPDYAQRWLMAWAPVKVRGADTGLVVMIQDSYDELIGGALYHLKRTLLFLSLATLSLVAIVVVPLWTLVMRIVK